jgi:phosphocarrier protein HPr
MPTQQAFPEAGVSDEGLTPRPTTTRAFTVLNPLGLHARPAALLVKTMTHYDCDVTVTADGYTANGRSLLGLLSLAAGCGTKLRFIATGPEACQALEAVRRLFKHRFQEAYEPQLTPTTAGNRTSSSPVSKP